MDPNFFYVRGVRRLLPIYALTCTKTAACSSLLRSSHATKLKYTNMIRKRSPTQQSGSFKVRIPQPMKVHRTRSAGKQMIDTCFSRSAHVATAPMVEQSSVIAGWYTDICLRHVFQVLSKGRPKPQSQRGIRFSTTTKRPLTRPSLPGILKKQHVIESRQF